MKNTGMIKFWAYLILIVSGTLHAIQGMAYTQDDVGATFSGAFGDMLVGGVTLVPESTYWAGTQSPLVFTVSSNKVDFNMSGNISGYVGSSVSLNQWAFDGSLFAIGRPGIMSQSGPTSPALDVHFAPAQAGTRTANLTYIIQDNNVYISKLIGLQGRGIEDHDGTGVNPVYPILGLESGYEINNEEVQFTITPRSKSSTVEHLLVNLLVEEVDTNCNLEGSLFTDDPGVTQNNHDPDNYFFHKNGTGLDPQMGCLRQYVFITTRDKPFQFLASLARIADSGYVDYTFYLEGHWDKNNPSRWPGGYTTFRLSSTPPSTSTYSLAITNDDDPDAHGGVTRNLVEFHSCTFMGCTQEYSANTQVVLTAIADSGYRFNGWNGDCQGSEEAITLTMDAPKMCTANFIVDSIGDPSTGDAHLTNLSTRAEVSGGKNDAVAGFVLSGDATETQDILLRGIAVDSDVDPMLTLSRRINDVWSTLGTNDEWELDPNKGLVEALPTNLQLPDKNENDAGIFLDQLEAGVYTAQLGSNTNPGLCVVGVDAVGTSGATLTNISTRARISGDQNDAYAGFVIEGTGQLKVMLRGIANDSTVDPNLTLLKKQNNQWQFVAANDEWEFHRNDALVRNLPTNLHLPDKYGNDAGMLLKLGAGIYSLQLSSGSSAGLGIVGVDVVE